jgi:hypothetical protein
MLSLARYQGEAAMAEAARDAAPTDELRFLHQQILDECFTAARHRLLVDRFAAQADSERRTGQRLAGRRGEAARAEGWMQKAAQSEAVAANHRAAADRCFDHANEMRAQAADLARAAVHPEAGNHQAGNPHPTGRRHHATAAPIAPHDTAGDA